MGELSAVMREQLELNEDVNRSAEDVRKRSEEIRSSTDEQRGPPPVRSSNRSPAQPADAVVCATGAEQMLATAENTASMVEKLRDAIDFFTLDEDRGGM